MVYIVSFNVLFRTIDCAVVILLVILILTIILLKSYKKIGNSFNLERISAFSIAEGIGVHVYFFARNQGLFSLLEKDDLIVVMICSVFTLISLALPIAILELIYSAHREKFFK